MAQLLCVYYIVRRDAVAGIGMHNPYTDKINCYIASGNFYVCIKCVCNKWS